MKKIVCICFVSVLTTLLVNAQETTYGGKKSWMASNEGPIARVMIISFEDKMYRSHVDRDIGKHNQMTQPEVCNLFQQAVPAKIADGLGSNYDVMAYEELTENSRGNAPTFVHESLHYEFEELQTARDSTGMKKLFKRSADKRADHSSESNGIQEGQVAVRVSEKEKYTKAIIRNDTLLQHLGRSFAFDYLVIISELDFTYHVTNPDLAAYGGIVKELKSHYTIYSKEGKMVVSGVKRTHFDNQDNNVHQIIEEHLPKLTDQIVRTFESKILADLN